MPNSSPNLSVRPATEKDSESIVQMIHELALYERAPDSCHASVEKLNAQLFSNQPSAWALVALLRQEPIGFAIFFQNFSTWECAPGIYLEDLFVRPQHRRLGAGKRLFAEVAQFAIARQCARLDFSVLDWNTSAIEFYKSLGAQPLNEWTTFRLPKAAIVTLAGR